MFQTKVVQKIKTHFVFSNFFFFENRTVYEIMWKNIVERGRPQMTMWRMCNACWIPKSTKTHSEYVLLIAFPLQWLHERASLLRYTHSADIVIATFMQTASTVASSFSPLHPEIQRFLCH